MDATRGLTSHYGSLVMPGTGLGGRGDGRGGQYDLTKGSDAFSSAAAAGYYAMSRFGSDLGVDTGLPGTYPTLTTEWTLCEHYTNDCV